jgi:hypothetical protein
MNTFEGAEFGGETNLAKLGRRERLSLLPPGVCPLGFTREQAARYWGVSASKFDELRKQGIAPRPKIVGGKKLWFRPDLDDYYARIPYEGGEEHTSLDCGGEW